MRVVKEAFQYYVVGFMDGKLATKNSSKENQTNLIFNEKRFSNL